MSGQVEKNSTLGVELSGELFFARVRVEELEHELREATQDEITYFKRMEELETKLRNGAENGETPEIRAWCVLALCGAVNERSASNQDREPS